MFPKKVIHFAIKVRFNSKDVIKSVELAFEGVEEFSKRRERLDVVLTFLTLKATAPEKVTIKFIQMKKSNFANNPASK